MEAMIVSGAMCLDHQSIGIGGHQRIQGEQVAGILEYPALFGIVGADELQVAFVSGVRGRPVLAGEPARISGRYASDS